MSEAAHQILKWATFFSGKGKKNSRSGCKYLRRWLPDFESVIVFYDWCHSAISVNANCVRRSASSHRLQVNGQRPSISARIGDLSTQQVQI